MRCQHPGCFRTLVVDCVRPELERMVHEIPILKPAAREQLFHDLVEYYCPEHCPEHGYCWNCGFYQGNSEEFRRNGGLCPECAREMDSRFL